MVPSLSVHVAAISVKATVSCPHRVACLAKSIAKQERPETRLFWSPSQAEESVFGRSPVLLAGNEGPGWIGYVILIGWNSVLN